MGWKAVSQILVIFSLKYVGISLFQFDITELCNIELMGVIFGVEGGRGNKR